MDIGIIVSIVGLLALSAVIIYSAAQVGAARATLVLLLCMYAVMGIAAVITR